MGITVREKPKGSGIFWLFISVIGLRKSKKIGTKAAALKVKEVMEAQLTLKQLKLADVVSANTGFTLAVYAMTCLETCVKGILSDSTYERYLAVLKKDILPALGRLQLSVIEPKHIRNLLNKLTREGRTSKSIALTRTVLSSILAEAVVEGHIKSNPVSIVMQNRKRSKVSESRAPKVHKVNPLTKEETSQFLQTVFTYSPNEYWPLFLCAFRTGLRLGELLALHWSDIDWKGRTIHVQRSFNRSKVKATKTGINQRVDISDQLYQVLRKLFEEQKLRAAQKGTWRTSDIIFPIDGQYRAQNSVRKAFKSFLKRADLREIRFHDIRHTYASILISNGASLSYIRDQLGHTSIKTTGDIYAHLLPSSMRGLTNLLDDPVVANK